MSNHTVFMPCKEGRHSLCPQKVGSYACTCTRCRSHGIATKGIYAGQPSSRERLAEMLSRQATEQECRIFRLLRSRLGSDPSIEEFRGYVLRQGREAI